MQPTPSSRRLPNSHKTRSTPDVWGYFSVDSSGLVHEFADSQFGHLFATGKDREAARKVGDFFPFIFLIFCPYFVCKYVRVGGLLGTRAVGPRHPVIHPSILCVNQN